MRRYNARGARTKQGSTNTTGNNSKETNFQAKHASHNSNGCVRRPRPHSSVVTVPTNETIQQGTTTPPATVSSNKRHQQQQQGVTHSPAPHAPLTKRRMLKNNTAGNSPATQSTVSPTTRHASLQQQRMCAQATKTRTTR